MFKRVGENLEVEVPLTIPEAVRGAVVEVPTLKGTKRLRVAAGTKHGTVQRLRGEGPAHLNGKGRGDIRYRFVIDVPDSLSAEQAEAVDRLSQVMNGNPRAKLFAQLLQQARRRGETGAELDGLGESALCRRQIAAAPLRQGQIDPRQFEPGVLRQRVLP